MSDTLLPCPFCGCGVFPVIVEMPNSQGGSGFKAGCIGCGAGFPVAFTRGLALREWNRRARDPIRDELVAALESGLALLKDCERNECLGETGDQETMDLMRAALAKVGK